MDEYIPDLKDYKFNPENDQHFRKLLEKEIPKIPSIPYCDEGNQLKKIWDYPEPQVPFDEIRYNLIFLISERNRQLEWIKRGKFCPDETREDCLRKLNFIDGEVRALMWVLLGYRVRL